MNSRSFLEFPFVKLIKLDPNRILWECMVLITSLVVKYFTNAENMTHIKNFSCVNFFTGKMMQKKFSYPMQGSETFGLVATKTTTLNLISIQYFLKIRPQNLQPERLPSETWISRKICLCKMLSLAPVPEKFSFAI